MSFGGVLLNPIKCTVKCVRLVSWTTCGSNSFCKVCSFLCLPQCYSSRCDWIRSSSSLYWSQVTEKVFLADGSVTVTTTWWKQCTTMTCPQGFQHALVHFPFLKPLFSVLYLTAAERVNFSPVICSHLDDGLSPFDVKAVQVKHEQGLRSEVMDELNVAVWAECWSLMLDESERGHYRPGECNTGTARQTWQFRSVPNLQPPPKRSCTHSSQAIYNREPGRADSFYSVWKSVLKN